MTKRYQLNQSQWERIEQLLPGKREDPGRSAQGNRLFVHKVLWVLRSGERWSDLPERYGKWKSVHKRFTRWAKAGVWKKVFAWLLKDPKNDFLMLDATLVKGDGAEVILSLQKFSENPVIALLQLSIVARK